MRNGVVLAALVLAACGQGGSDQQSKATAPEEAAPKATAPVQLPPSIVASKSFRCKDNSVVVIDFLSDGSSANVSPGRDKPAVHIEARTAGEPMTGFGWTVKGGKDDKVVTVTAPGTTKAVSCRSGPQEKAPAK